MGCDGGTIPKRDEVVTVKKKPQKTEKEVEKAAKWNYCHLSQELLQKPIIADRLGNLYNKDAYIKHLIEHSKTKKLQNFVDLNLKSNPDYVLNQIKASNEFIDFNVSRWICPITGLEMNGVYRFYCIFTCGCVISERALKSISSTTTNKCLNCDRFFSNNDLVVLNPNEEDLQSNQEKFCFIQKSINLRNNVESVKPECKSIPIKSNCTLEESERKSFKKTDLTPAKGKKRNHDKSECPNSDMNTKNNTIENSKRCKTIQDDPNVSAVFKSLFNTCEKAKNQQKANWITCNSYYYY